MKQVMDILNIAFVVTFAIIRVYYQIKLSIKRKGGK